MKEKVRESFRKSAGIFQKFAVDENVIENTYQAAELIADALKRSNKILICGNGGSSTDAMHFAEEMTGNFRKPRKALSVIALTDPSHITCVGNDFGFEEIFSRSVEAYGKENDVLIAISTSGNSENIINAVKKAKKLGLNTIGILGKDGGKLKNICERKIVVQADTTDRIQALHITVLHTIIEIVERTLFPENY